MFYPQVPGEAEHFPGDFILKSVSKGEGEQHGGYTDGSGGDSEPDNKAGK